MAKLSKAQLELLRELPVHCVPEYRPAQALVRLGLAEWCSNRCEWLAITPAGRAALTKDTQT